MVGITINQSDLDEKKVLQKIGDLQLKEGDTDLTLLGVRPNNLIDLAKIIKIIRERFPQIKYIRSGVLNCEVKDMQSITKALKDSDIRLCIKASYGRIWCRSHSPEFIQMMHILDGKAERNLINFINKRKVKEIYIYKGFSFKNLGKVVKNCTGIEKVDALCDLNFQDSITLVKALEDSNVKVLDLSYNPMFQVFYYPEKSKAMKKYYPEESKTVKMEDFFEALVNSKITSLSLSLSKTELTSLRLDVSKTKGANRMDEKTHSSFNANLKKYGSKLELEELKFSDIRGSEAIGIIKVLPMNITKLDLGNKIFVPGPGSKITSMQIAEILADAIAKSQLVECSFKHLDLERYSKEIEIIQKAIRRNIAVQEVQAGETLGQLQEETYEDSLKAESGADTEVPDDEKGVETRKRITRGLALHIAKDKKAQDASENIKQGKQKKAPKKGPLRRRKNTPV